MDKYVRVETEKLSLPSVPNEVRIMTDGKMRNYIKYAITLLMVRSRSFAAAQPLFALVPSPPTRHGKKQICNHHHSTYIILPNGKKTRHFSVTHISTFCSLHSPIPPTQPRRTSLSLSLSLSHTHTLSLTHSHTNPVPHHSQPHSLHGHPPSSSSSSSSFFSLFCLLLPPHHKRAGQGRGLHCAQGDGSSHQQDGDDSRDRQETSRGSAPEHRDIVHGDNGHVGASRGRFGDRGDDPPRQRGEYHAVPGRREDGHGCAGVSGAHPRGSGGAAAADDSGARQDEEEKEEDERKW